MQTEVMCPTRAAAWLEFTPPSSSRAQTIPLEGGPFCLGRTEAADFQVDSNRVSREHAVIERRAGQWRIRDLKSTNGTFVNGKRIDETLLHDGDMIVVADVELVFHHGAAVSQESAFTQVMGEGGDWQTPEDGFAAWVRAVRRLREAMLRGGLPVRREPVFRLADGELFGYEVLGPDDSAPGAVENRLFATDCLLTDRLREVQRLSAVEDAAELDLRACLLLELAASEVGARGFIESLEALCEQAGGRRLIAEIPFSAVCDTPKFRDFLAVLRDHEIAVLYDNFAANGSHTSLQKNLAPEYVKLAPSLTRDVEESAERQEQIRAIVEACRSVGCEAAVQGVSQPAAADLCRELGCTLGQGEFFHVGHSLRE